MISRRLVVPLLLLIMLAISAVHFASRPAYGDILGNRSLQLENNELAAPSEYALSFDIVTAGNLGSIAIQFCSNNPTPGDQCDAPGGFTTASASLVSQTGPGGFTISNAGSANQIILTRSSAPAAAGPARFRFANIINPSTPGSYYVRIQTYASSDASGSASDYGGIAFAVTNSLSITATVPPYLIFCTGITISGLNCENAKGDYIDFGELSSTRANNGSSQMLVATNAGNGFAISMQGTTLTSGNNAITALASNDFSRPGTGQFGLNLTANSTPFVGSGPTGPGNSSAQANYNQVNSFRFVSGDTLVSNDTTDDSRLFTASYITNVSKVQPAGVYVSTITYICLANF